MPELPEVETIRRGIVPHLETQVIQTVIVRETRLRWPVPDRLAKILSGQQLQQIGRRGKYLLFQCTTGHLLIHLGMSGNLRLLPLSTKVKKHDHLDLIFANRLCLRYHDPRRFGSVLWTTEPIFEHPLLVNLGPEPLSSEFTGDYLHRLARGKEVAIKNYLMDGHIVVGVGNIYANESLFLAGLHPARPAGEVSRHFYQKLVKQVKQVLIKAIELGGTTLRDYSDSAGQQGHFRQALQVYGRAGEACLKCGHQIQVQKIGQRASYFCPRCQR